MVRNRVLIGLYVAAVSALVGTSANAQAWQGSGSDTGGLVYGWATDPGNTLSFTCNAPSLQGLPLFQTGDHETTPTGPFEMSVDFAMAVADPGQVGFQLTEAVIEVDGTGYRLPLVQWNELVGSWEVNIPMADQMVQALYTAQSLVFRPHPTLAWSYPVEGLELALDAALRGCVDTWAAQGHTIPTALNRYWPVVDEGAMEQPAALTPAPDYTVDAVPQIITERIERWCTGGGSIDLERGLGTADFDGDGLPDYVFNGYGVSCNEGINPFCGASNCTVDVMLSSLGYEAGYSWIGLDFEIGTTASGIAGVRRSSRAAGPLEIWDGAAFVPDHSLAADAVPPEHISVPPIILAYVASICGEGFALPYPDAIQSGNFDDDGRDDYVIGWREVVCPDASIANYCGASHCNIDAFLSSRSYVRSDVGVGPSVGVAPLVTGRDGIGFTLSGFPVLLSWTGSEWADALHLWDQEQ